MTLEEIRKNGFKDREELQLYQDVCATNLPIIGQGYVEKLYFVYTNRDEINQYQSKERYEKYIFKYGLKDLFEKVKNMSEFDRLITIFNYYKYAEIICMTTEYSAMNDKAETIFDIPKYTQAKEEYEKAKVWRAIYSDKANYILAQAGIRLKEHYKEFYKKIQNLDKLRQLVSKNINKQKRLRGQK